MFEFLKKNIEGLILLVIFSGLMFNILHDHYKDDQLKDSKEVIGILIKERHTSLNFQFGEFYYYAGKKRYELTYFDDFSHKKKGDTVQIKYARKDPSIAVVSDRYLMKRFWHLKKK